MKVAVLCSETPIIGDEPETAKAKIAESASMDFLKDHWAYNEEELIRLLDICFGWKAGGELESGGYSRDVIFVTGDIHCGVSSIVRDQETGLQINHLVTSPVTNHVCKFFPALQGSIDGGRYTFSHLPLGESFRNYADIGIRILEDEEVSVQAQLVPISTDIFKDKSWKQGSAE